MEATDTTIRVNGVALHCDISGSGDPLVLVHGGWTDHTTWRGIVPDLSESYTVVAYDRRGHSRSRDVADGPRATHEDDLISLIETLGRGPVHLVGSSYGALIALGVGARRPELVRSIVAHEPPAVAWSSAVTLVHALFGSYGKQVRAGDAAGGARRFVEDVLGTGMWDHLPEDLRQTIVANAPTFIETLDDPAAFDVDVDALASHPFPILLTNGSETPSWLRDIVPALVAAIDGVEHHTFVGAGHMPHGTHPDALVEAVRVFC